MKLTNNQFTEAAFIFEKMNGKSHSDYEKRIIAESVLTEYEPSILELRIIDGLNSGIYKNEDERVNGYWALSKIGNPNLISVFQNWLRSELKSKNAIAIFQLLVALDQLEEPAFSKDRKSRDVEEMEMNIRDAKRYLNKKPLF